MTIKRNSAIDAMFVASAVLIALLLGFANLGKPSLWHDEAVQVFVSKSIVDVGRALLPSGHSHPVAPVFNGIMALFIRFFGDSEVVVRSPSVFFSAINVLLTYLVIRPLLGRGAAIVAAFALALSPWSVAWARQARFYSAQQTTYLLLLWAGWRAISAETLRASIGFASTALCAYLVGLGMSLHSILFLGQIGAYAFFMMVHERGLKNRWTLICAISGIVVGLTILVYYLALPPMDARVIFTAMKPIDIYGDPAQTSRLYYASWLSDNLGSGFFILAAMGLIAMTARERSKGLFAALAFIIPLFALSFLIGYRRHRFLLFAFPLYTAAFSYGAVFVAEYIRDTWKRRSERSWGRFVIVGVLALFSARLVLSAALLVRDSIEVAHGADTTLATRHPQFREPCLYAREHLTPEIAVITDTYVTALYYIGRVDNWFPSRFCDWESWEIGFDGLRTVDELKTFIAEHPKGYFLAEWCRFQLYNEVKPDRDWVNANMKRIPEASTGDVTLYSWGM
jgi:4-amino-4-deoxy-L-arabinose transferase-like glycosyltransferase